MIRATLWIAVVVAAVVGGLRYADSLATVGVSRVSIEADLTESELHQVRQAVAAELARPGVRAVADVAAAVEGLGWVHQVRVRRQWPDSLRIAIVRETLAASWGGEGFLTTGGDVVTVLPDLDRQPPEDLPVLKASLSDGFLAMDVYNLLSGSARDAGLRIVRLEEDRAGSWTVELGDGTEVVLGSTALRARFERFLAVYRSALRDTVASVERIDARYHAGVSVRWNAHVQLAAVNPPPNPGQPHATAMVPALTAADGFGGITR